MMIPCGRIWVLSNIYMVFTWLPSTTICGSWMASDPTVLNTSCSLLTTGMRASMISRRVVFFVFDIIKSCDFNRIKSFGVYTVEERQPTGFTLFLFSLLLLGSVSWRICFCNWFFKRNSSHMMIDPPEKKRGIASVSWLSFERAPESQVQVEWGGDVSRISS